MFIMGDQDNSFKKYFPTTRIWHAADTALGMYAYKKDPSKLNLIRLGFALIGLFGNVIIAASKHE